MDRPTQRSSSPAGLLVIVLFASLIGAVRVWQTPAHGGNSLTTETAIRADVTVPLEVTSTMEAPHGNRSLHRDVVDTVARQLPQHSVELASPPPSLAAELPSESPALDVAHLRSQPAPVATLSPPPPAPNADLDELLPSSDRVKTPQVKTLPHPDLIRILVNDRPDIVTRREPPADPQRPTAAPHQAIKDVSVPAPGLSSAAANSWPAAKTLIHAIDQISAPHVAEWKRQVIAWLTAISQSPTKNRAQLTQAVQQLERLSRLAEPLARQCQQPENAVAIRTSGYALARRTQLWGAVLAVDAATVKARCKQYAAQDHGAMMRHALTQAVSTLKRSQHQEAWTEFLGIKELAAVANSNAVNDDQARLALAGNILDRVLDDELSDQQKQFLSQTSLRNLKNVLHSWSTGWVDVGALLHAIEQLEAQPNTANSQNVAAFWRQLKYSSLPEHRRLAAVIDQHYRNANVRFAATENFLNRLVPAIQNIKAPVREMILGAQVNGQSDSKTQLMVDLLPGEEQINIRLNAQGRMNAKTQSSKGAVRFFSSNNAKVFARKQLSLGLDSIRIGRADAIARGRTNILGLDTQYDNFPIVGSIVRRVAIQKQFESKTIARRLFEHKVANKAKSRLDAQVGQQLAKAQQRLKDRVLNPLDSMALEPTALAMRSTNNRMEMRGRLAADHQMGAFSARPRPLPNNMVDMQIHQSAINNFLDQVQLEGREGTVRDVFRSIATDLGFGELEVPEEVPEDFHIKLATVEPIRVDCDQDRVKLTIRVSQLRGDRLNLRNFQVVSFFVPETDGIKCDLRRQGGIQVSCRRKNLLVRTIFTKVLSKNRAIPMVYPEIAEHPKMQGLQLTQLVLRDGWVGVSVGQSEPAVRVSSRDHTRR